MTRSLALRLGLAVVLTMLAAGCNSDTPVEKAADDARDVAMVERMSKEPFQPILPKPITPVDDARYGLDRAGCRFTRKGGKMPIFVAGSQEGFMHTGPDLNRFAAKTTSAVFSGHAHSIYVGLDSWVEIMRLPDEAMESTDTRWPARLIVHDAQERVAFRADGVMDCSAPEGIDPA